MSNLKPKPLALFDFDHTIINRDSAGEFIPFAIRRRKWRKALLLLSMPLIWILSASKHTHWRRNWLYYQIAVTRLSDVCFTRLKESFYHYLFEQRGFKGYPEALNKIQFHLEEGHDVVIVSGSLQWLLEDLCTQLGIENALVLGSSKDFFCFGQNKVKKLKQLGILENRPTIYGYSDSSADIPMLSCCEHITIVNPKEQCAEMFDQAFSDRHIVVSWS